MQVEESEAGASRNYRLANSVPRLLGNYPAIWEPGRAACYCCRQQKLCKLQHQWLETSRQLYWLRFKKKEKKEGKKREERESQKGSAEERM